MGRNTNIVAHNLSGMFSNRQLGIVEKQRSKSTEKLSSGYKINRAADDAAGLSISEKMRRQIRGLSKAAENCEDGASLCQVADGGLVEIHDMLHRLNELAVKSANATLTDSDRAFCQEEASRLKDEIDRVAKRTSFNEQIYPLCGETATQASSGNSGIDKYKYTFESIKKYNASFRTFQINKFYIDGDPTEYHNYSNVKINDSFVWKTVDSGSEVREIFYFVDKDSDGKYEYASAYDLNNMSGAVSFLSNYACDKGGNGPDGSYAMYNHDVYLTDGATIKFAKTSDLKTDADGYAYLSAGGNKYYFYPDIGVYDCPKLISPANATDPELSNLDRNKCVKSDVLQSMIKENSSAEKKDDGLRIQAGSEENQDIYIHLVDARSSALGISALNLSTEEDSIVAIGLVKKALSIVSSYRSQFGSKQNQLESAIKKLENTVENTTDAESLMRDTDISTEMVRHSNLNILSKSGESVLSQANSSQETILKLLK